MDPLRRDDIERARATPPDEKARQAFDAVRTGIRLERASLRARHPKESDDDIESRLRQWIGGDD